MASPSLKRKSFNNEYKNKLENTPYTKVVKSSSGTRPPLTVYVLFLLFLNFLFHSGFTSVDMNTLAQNGEGCVGMGVTEEEASVDPDATMVMSGEDLGKLMLEPHSKDSGHTNITSKGVYTIDLHIE